jgi:hypothetical protein
VRVHGDVVGAGHGAVKHERGEERRGVVRQWNGEKRKAESGGGPTGDRISCSTLWRPPFEKGGRGDFVKRTEFKSPSVPLFQRGKF